MISPFGEKISRAKKKPSATSFFLPSGCDEPDGDKQAPPSSLSGADGLIVGSYGGEKTFAGVVRKVALQRDKETRRGSYSA